MEGERGEPVWEQRQEDGAGLAEKVSERFQKTNFSEYNRFGLT